MKRMGNKKYIPLKSFSPESSALLIKTITDNDIVNVDITCFRLVGHFIKTKDVQTDNKVNILFVLNNNGNYDVSGMVCGYNASVATSYIVGFNDNENGMGLEVGINAQDVINDYRSSSFEGYIVLDEVNPEDAVSFYSES